MLPRGDRPRPELGFAAAGAPERAGERLADYGAAGGREIAVGGD